MGAPQEQPNFNVEAEMPPLAAVPEAPAGQPAEAETGPAVVLEAIHKPWEIAGWMGRKAVGAQRYFSKLADKEAIDSRPHAELKQPEPLTRGPGSNTLPFARHMGARPTQETVKRALTVLAGHTDRSKRALKRQGRRVAGD